MLGLCGSFIHFSHANAAARLRCHADSGSLPQSFKIMCDQVKLVSALVSAIWKAVSSRPQLHLHMPFMLLRGIACGAHQHKASAKSLLERSQFLGSVAPRPCHQWQKLHTQEPQVDMLPTHKNQESAARQPLAGFTPGSDVTRTFSS